MRYLDYFGQTCYAHAPCVYAAKATGSKVDFRTGHVVRLTRLGDEPRVVVRWLRPDDGPRESVVKPGNLVLVKELS